MATRRFLTTTTTTLRRLTTAKTTPHFSLLRTLSATSHLTLPTLPPSSRRLFFTQHAPTNSKSKPDSKETGVPEGCDFEHWLVIMDPPPLTCSREQIIDYYVKTLATAVGSEDEARMKIYSVSTKHYFAFGALIPEELLSKLREQEKVRWVLPDAYLNVRNKDYGGEPFINGQAAPYDPKYHAYWVWNNQKGGNRSAKAIDNFRRNFDYQQTFGTIEPTLEDNVVVPPDNDTFLSQQTFGLIEPTLGGNDVEAPDQRGPPINAGGGPNMLPPSNTGDLSNMPPNTAAGDQNAPNDVHQSQNFPGEDAPQ